MSGPWYEWALPALVLSVYAGRVSSDPSRREEG
jgi:hypothetical protein